MFCLLVCLFVCVVVVVVSLFFSSPRAGGLRHISAFRENKVLHLFKECFSVSVVIILTRSNSKRKQHDDNN